MATKRPLESGPSDSDEPQAKRPTAILPAVSIGSISSLVSCYEIFQLMISKPKLSHRFCYPLI